MSGVKVVIQHNGATVNALSPIVEPVTVRVGANPSHTIVVNKNPREIQLQNDGTYVQWKYIGDAEWMNLIPLALLRGVSVDFRTSDTHIQFKYADETNWTDLVPFTHITGPQGIQGLQGLKGDKGDKGDTGDTGAQGPPGSSNLLFQKRLFKGNGVDDYVNLVGIHNAIFCMVFVGMIPFDEADENDPLEPFQFKRSPNQITLGTVPEVNERILVYYVQAI
jgi:hypothetical protein